MCATQQNISAKEPLLYHEIPDRPWCKLGVDLFENKSEHNLLVVDYYSKLPEVIKLDNLSSANTIQYLKSLISRYGYPDTIISDNGPQFSSHEFRQFASDYCFEHITSRPRYPQSNGQAERTVQTVKTLLEKLRTHIKL